MKYKFSVEDVTLVDDDRLKQLLSLLAQGKTVADIATQFKVTPNHIRGLIKKAQRQIDCMRKVKDMVAKGKVSEILLTNLLPKACTTPLGNADLYTVGDVSKKTEAELLKYHSFGKKTLRILKERLASLGVQLVSTNLKEEVWPQIRALLQEASYTDGAIGLFHEMLNALGYDVRICRRQ